ncbi:hypothetical protein [Piscirickettsia litoralis]|uniref:Uncharacterized protein n=1 Tax=Piscirickettsia litoralis TaxID=1891921 RepID=A0ABX3A1G8_9GAMM|nr:hypothetical protein [Piscirickettsia litoralis]ODN42474.1 hypothetical protein BGC07_05450 [Piscirickettsia litoralis]
MRTAYMYKYELLNKLRDTFGFDNEIDYNHCVAKLLHLSDYNENHLLFIPDDKLQEHFQSLNKKRTRKNLLEPVNNFDIQTSLYLSIKGLLERAKSA